MVKHQDGFGSVALIALMPLLMAMAGFAAAFAATLTIHAHATHICRAGLLSLQSHAAQNLEKLWSLNPLARSLREKIQEQELLLDDPATAGAATIMLAELHTEHVTLHQRQTALIAAVRSIDHAESTRTHQAILRALSEHAHQFDSAKPGAYTRHFKEAHLSLIATPDGDLTPDYNTPPDFSSEQTATIDIEVPLASLLPGWLLKILASPTLAIHTRCAANLTQQGNGKTWNPILTADK
jgi:hypothetical protein